MCLWFVVHGQTVRGGQVCVGSGGGRRYLDQRRIDAHSPLTTTTPTHNLLTAIPGYQNISLQKKEDNRVLEWWVGTEAATCVVPLVRLGSLLTPQMVPQMAPTQHLTLLAIPLPPAKFLS